MGSLELNSANGLIELEAVFPRAHTEDCFPAGPRSAESLGGESSHAVRIHQLQHCELRSVRCSKLRILGKLVTATENEYAETGTSILPRGTFSSTVLHLAVSVWVLNAFFSPLSSIKTVFSFAGNF